ncbi:MAG: hypothetical protein MI757_21595, partial [Pirellulales bacterium]|nr:hypothetical protein [Pirellulales bacterium]
GAKVVIEGPAEFVVGGKQEAEGGKEGNRHQGTKAQIEGKSARSSSPQSSPLNPHPSSANSGYLSLGRLVARCDSPESKGLSIVTPTARVVDLSTEFAVEVRRDGKTKLHVFEGKVELNSDEGKTTRVVLAGDSLLVARDAAGRAQVTPIASRVESIGRLCTVFDAVERIGDWVPDVEVAPSWDGYVQYKGKIRRGTSELLVKNDHPGANLNREAWMRFDLGEIDLARVDKAELVLTVSQGIHVDRRASAETNWQFEVVAMWLDDENPLDVADLTWAKTRELPVAIVAQFAIPGALPVTERLRANGEALAEFLRQAKSSAVILAVRRVTPHRNVAHGFAGSRQAELGPFLQVQYKQSISSPDNSSSNPSIDDLEVNSIPKQ